MKKSFFSFILIVFYNIYFFSNCSYGTPYQLDRLLGEYVKKTRARLPHLLGSDIRTYHCQRTLQETADVVVIGGGPSGISAALTLLRSSPLKVIVIDNNDHLLQVGEVVNSSIQDILKYLGASDGLKQDVFIPSSGIASTWGGGKLIERDSVFNIYGKSFHLDRTAFNKQLRDCLEKNHQAKLFFPYSIKEMKKEENEFIFRISDKKNSEDYILRSKFLIDCSGRRAFFSRQLGAENVTIDRLIGITRYHTYDNRKVHIPYTVLIEPVQHGWWYSAALPNSKLVTTFMCDANHLQSHKIYKLPLWNAALKETDFIGKRVNLCEEEIGSFKVSAAFSRYLKRAGGKDWIAAGDAACSFDPLSSLGIGHALTSGIQAGIVARRKILEEKDYTDIYSQDIVNNFLKYMIMRNAFYKSEVRWRNTHFWNSRQT